MSESSVSKKDKGIKKFVGISEDGRTNLWRVSCFNCKTQKPDIVDTMYRFYSYVCHKCNSINRFDFNE